ncbi:hypothetical protein AALP_AA6G357000 [Arabis alpina]|uniref:Uncharacterized protein n=1 Tax=Arabis alpina TaxID=50452 RepID=A0A087GTU7_ARAAL|nr:hypothetical protein AALP_AA6G357000 [Arabis alpina]
MEGGSSFDDPEFVELVKQVQHEMATALPKPVDESPPIYALDCDGFLVGEHIKPVQWETYYDTGLCARLGLYCYNFQNFLKQCYERFGSDLTKMFITLEAMNPKRLPFRRSPLTLETCVQFAGFSHRTLSWWETCVCRLQGSEEADHVWNHDAINDHYKSELPNWWSPDQHHRYKVQELLDLDHWWLHLFTEFAFFSKWSAALRPADIADSLPLKTRKMVVETRGETAMEPREMLNAPNAIFYIKFCCENDPATGGLANYKAVVRKTMDGKPGHMRLEARCWTV